MVDVLVCRDAEGEASLTYIHVVTPTVVRRELTGANGMCRIDGGAQEGNLHRVICKTAAVRAFVDDVYANVPALENIPVGTMVHNIELTPGKGGQIARSAGISAQIMAVEGKYATLRMPSGEMRYVLLKCRATIGQVGNVDHELVSLGKAGKARYLGLRPEVRGSVMNPVDHPHGGGEGKSPIGRPSPVTPWGKPALGYKTRNKKARTDKFIVRRRNGK